MRTDNVTTLGEFEELMLRTILHLGNETYGVPIRQTLEDICERTVSIGSVYTTLERMEEKGFVKSWQGEATAERGGRAKKYFKVEDNGIQALQRIDRIRNSLLANYVPSFS